MNYHERLEKAQWRKGHIHVYTKQYKKISQNRKIHICDSTNLIFQDFPILFCYYNYMKPLSNKPFFTLMQSLSSIIAYQNRKIINKTEKAQKSAQPESFFSDNFFLLFSLSFYLFFCFTRVHYHHESTLHPCPPPLRLFRLCGYLDQLRYDFHYFYDFSKHFYHLLNTCSLPICLFFFTICHLLQDF